MIPAKSRETLLASAKTATDYTDNTVFIINLCNLCNLCNPWLTQHFCNQSIDVDAGGVEQLNAVMFVSA